MIRLRKLILTLTAVSFVLGALAVAHADRPATCEPTCPTNCKNPCKLVVNKRGLTCLFAYCDGKGMCVYDCLIPPLTD